MLVNSHKQIHKSLMKGFSHKMTVTYEGKTNKADAVYYLDFSDFQIKEELIKKLGTEYGYFDDETEAFLGKVESNFGELIKEVQNLTKEKKKNPSLSIIFDLNKYEIAIKEYIKYALVRSSKMIHEIKSKSITPQIMPEEFCQSLYTPSNIIKIASGMELKIIENFIDGFMPNLMINESNVNFITSKSCWYSHCWKDGEYQVYIPITERIAIIMFEKRFIERYRLLDGSIGLQSVTKDEMVKTLNELSLRSELNQDGEFLIAKNREDLLALQQKLTNLQKKI